MVSKRDTNRSKSPCLNVTVELDNRALKAKNTTLTQTVAKLQQDNAELVKQINLLQGESFEINSKYNNLKNVISIIDSTTKTCLPKLNEVVETFTGIIQLCSVAANISSFTVVTSSPNKDVRTHAVKPQIVNGHILRNPTITLSRLSNDDSNTPPRATRISIDAVRPSTSRADSNEVTNRPSNRNREEDTNNDSENGRHQEDEEQDTFVCTTNRGSHRNRSEDNVDMSRRLQRDFEDSDEENEEPIDEESDEQNEQRLTTIHEVEEEDQDIMNSVSPRSRQRRFLQGRLQEVRIYLNQLPNTYIEQFRGSGNISISVSPPERRSSFKHRNSSMVGDANDSVMENGRLFLDDQLNYSRLSQGEVSFGENLRMGKSKTNLSVSMNSPVAMRGQDYYEAGSSSSNTLLEQFTESISAIQNLQSPMPSKNETSSMQSDSMKGSTPIVSRLSQGTLNKSSRFGSPNRSKNDSLSFAKNVTKRKTNSRDKRKVAKVLLNRLSLEKRLSGSPIKGMEDMVNVIRKSSEMVTRTKSGAKAKNHTRNGSSGSSNSDEENIEKPVKGKGKAKRRKKDSKTKKVNENLIKQPIKIPSPPKSPVGRPKRAARPKTLKEPNLTKKMRRSK